MTPPLASRVTRHLARLAALAFATAVGTVVVLCSTIAVAAAQTSSLDGPGSAYAPPVEDSPFNSGGLVFFFVAAVLAVGAGLLYFRNRPSSRTPSEPTP